MKQTFIKSLCLAMLWCGITMQASAQGIVVNKLDGTKAYYKASEVQSVGVYGYGEGPDDNPELHEYVDLGLPSGTLWATCNVGASSPEEYGDYFAWGELEPKQEYTEETYEHIKKGFLGINKYVALGDISGNAQYDAARSNWGGSWRLPTKGEMEELEENCTWSWTTQGGKRGCNVTGPNGNSIFLPAAGFRGGSSLFGAGSSGNYWGSAPYDSDSIYYAYYLNFNSSSRYMNGYSRSRGRSVRPVSE